jgi:Mrp family chromosome partitioning ATPase
MAGTHIGIKLTTAIGRIYVSDVQLGEKVTQKSCSREQTEELYKLKEQIDLQETLFGIRNKIVVLSGKGGVGKSSVAANLAVSLSLQGKKTGLLDVDLHGPSIPTMLGIEGKLPASTGGRIEPVAYSENLKIMSVGLLLRDQSEAVVWRGPAKHGVIKQFLAAVEWGDLDYLIVDCPPGTGDEPLSVIQLLDGAEGAIIVTTPQDVALTDVRKSVTFCRQMNLPVIGVVENMSGFVCPHCGESVDIFKSGGGKKMADEMNVPFLGRIPLDPAMVSAGDAGAPFVEHQAASSTAKAFGEIVATVTELCTPGK